MGSTRDLGYDRSWYQREKATHPPMCHMSDMGLSGPLQRKIPKTSNRMFGEERFLPPVGIRVAQSANMCDECVCGRVGRRARPFETERCRWDKG